MSLESTKISNFMSSNVKTSQLTRPLFQICQIMKNNNIGSLIVVNESDFPVGIITERDIVYCIAQEEDTLQLQAQKIMTSPLITIKDSNSLIDALQIMHSHNFRRLPVINNEQKLIGIITDKDIIKSILSSKDLLSDYYDKEEFEPSYSILEEFRDRIFDTLYKP